MKFKIPKTDKLLNDKNVLYVIFVLAIINIVGYLLVQNTEAVAFFIIVGFLTTYFSKNMIIVLIVAMVSTSIFTATKSSYSSSFTEGMASSRSKENIDPSKIKQKQQDMKAKKPQNKQNDNSDNDDDEDISIASKGKHRVDLASTLNEAYSNLQNTVGEGGIKGLTDQTESLLNQQKQLMDNITTMQPFLETAQGFMDKLDLTSLDGIGDMLSKFGKK
jgi:hypothetical protein